MHCDRIFEKTKQIFIQGTPISTTNNTDRHNITDILLKVVLNTIILILRFPWHISKGEQVRDLILVRLCKRTETLYHFQSMNIEFQLSFIITWNCYFWHQKISLFTRCL